jgi:hypothetical protein
MQNYSEISRYYFAKKTDRDFYFSGGVCPDLARPLQEGYFPAFSHTTIASVIARIGGKYSESRQFLSSPAMQVSWFWGQISAAGVRQAHSRSKKPQSSGASSGSGGGFSAGGPRRGRSFHSLQ